MTATDTTAGRRSGGPGPSSRPSAGADGSTNIATTCRSTSRCRAGARRARCWANLLRPYRWPVALLAVVVVVENAARLSVPILVQRGIDHGIPPIVDGGSAHTLLMVVGVLCVVVLVQAVSRMFFLHRSGRIGQKVLLELRRRVFRHFQRLDIAFHERYTSGRVVSRSTNDVDAIEEMLETGFDSLITAVLTLLGTAILLVVLDVRLGLMCLAAFPILVGLVWWFSSESAKTYREVRESAALVIVQFVETMTGIKAVQAYRREPRNQEIFEGLADRYRDINEKTMKLLAVFMPGREAGRQPHHRRGAALRRLPGAARADDDRHADRLPAVPADVLRADAGDLAVLQHVPVRDVGAGEAGGRARRAAGHQGSGAARWSWTRCAATSRSTTCTSPTCPTARCCRT